MNVDISVIMPVYNAGKYLEESIESVLNQTYKNFEFIIINDGSKDDSLRIINYYAAKDDRIKIISRENKGLVYSLNEGIKLAKGEYIARMDADDISMPKRFTKQIDFLENHNQVDILGSKVSIIGNITDEEKFKHEKKLNILFNAEEARQTLLTHWYCLAHPSIMFKINVVTTLKGYKNYKAEDLELWLRALKNGFKIYKMNEKLLKYRIHNESKTSTDNKRFDGVKDGIKIKFLDVFNDCTKKNFRYLIWGASNGGKISKEVIENIIPDSTCIGFIDKFKKGEFERIKIFNPDKLNSIKFDYVFVATEPGKEEAINKLESMRLQNIKNFLCTI